MPSSWNFWSDSWNLPGRNRTNFQPYYNHWWNMDLLIWSRIQTIKYAVHKEGRKPPVKFIAQMSQLKMMTTIFWDCDRIILFDFLPRGPSINGVYYANLLTLLRAAVLDKWMSKVSRGVLLLHGNLPIHTSKVVKAALNETVFEETELPPYSPNLVPSNYNL